MNSYIRPFSNGSEFDSWMSSNCYKCEKYVTNDDGYSTCEIENGIACGAIDGVISQAIATDMGMVKTPSGWEHSGTCTEIKPIQRWHIMGEINGKSGMFFGPYDSIDAAAIAIKSAPLIINEVASLSKTLSDHLDNIKLSVEQTNTDTLGQIDRFITQRDEEATVSAFKWCADFNPNHLLTIEQRSNGSQWQYKGKNKYPWLQLTKLPWKRLYRYEYNPLIHKEDCHYFYVNCNTILGMQGFKLLSEFEEYSSIQMMDGNHGIELVSNQVVATSTNKAWLIIGTAQDSSGTKHPNKLMPWTAYPGELTASVKNIPGFNGTLDCAIEAAANGYPIAVKYYQN
jgi:hypothetical protein